MYSVIQITDNGTIAPTIFVFNNLASAKSNLFSFLASCYANNTLVYFMGMIVDEFGTVIDKEIWKDPTPVAE